MSMYAAIFGRNPDADLLLAMVGLTRGDVGRFRDAFAVSDEHGRRVHVYTRNGGGNREYCMPDWDEHPLYVDDYDDDFDCTYATIEFRVPDAAADVFDGMLGDDRSAPDMDERWAGMLDRLKAADPADAEVQRIQQAMEPLLKQIHDVLGSA